MDEHNHTFNFRGCATFFIYLFLSCAFFGRGLFGSFTAFHVGEGADPDLMMWFLVWWPHALHSGINPFLTKEFWAPTGFNVAWSTSIPLISIVAAPLTETIGPVATLNLLCLIGVAISAVSAFALCRYVCNDYWCALLGGYIFGFCPYVLGEVLFGRLHGIWCFPVPLTVYATLLRIDQRIGFCRYCALMIGILTTQFLCSTELFTLSLLVGGITLILMWLLTSPFIRKQINEIILLAGASLGATLMLVSPYLYYFFCFPPYDTSVWSPEPLSADFANLFIPSKVNLLGTLHYFDSLSTPFNLGVPAEQVAYLAYPLVLIAVLFYWRNRRQPELRLLTELLAILLLLSLGGVLVYRGNITNIKLPWALFRVSFLSNVATGRFILYVYLLFAIITSIWISEQSVSPLYRCLIAASVVVFMSPNPSKTFWISSAADPAFIHDNLYRNYLKEGGTILILPFWPRNESMRWQAESHMYFRLAQGPGPWPMEFKNWPILDAFYQADYMPDLNLQFVTYAAKHGVVALIVDDRVSVEWHVLTSSLDSTPTQVGGVSIYPLRGSSLSFADIRKTFDVERFRSLLQSVDGFVSNGGDYANLSASNIFRLKLLPRRDLIGPSAPPEILHPEHNWRQNPFFDYGFWLFINDDHRIVIGVQAWQESARQLISEFGKFAHEVHFVIPSNSKKAGLGALVMTFDRTELAAAAAAAKASETQMNRKKDGS